MRCTSTVSPNTTKTKEEIYAKTPSLTNKRRDTLAYVFTSSNKKIDLNTSLFQSYANKKVEWLAGLLACSCFIGLPVPPKRTVARDFDKTNSELTAAWTAPESLQKQITGFPFHPGNRKISETPTVQRKLKYVMVQGISIRLLLRVYEHPWIIGNNFMQQAMKQQHNLGY